MMTYSEWRQQLANGHHRLAKFFNVENLNTIQVFDVLELYQDEKA